MGGALGELGLVTGALGGLTGFSSILGGGALVLAVQSLDELATALERFGTMSWDEIGRGLSAMGGALGELGVVSGALGGLTGLAGLVGAGTITLAAQGLGEIADALIKFGSMSWDEIGRGLSAMGGALGELALGSFLNTFGILGSISIETVAEPLGALADSLKKFCEIDGEAAGKGIRIMSAALGELALGGFFNTLSIIGSASIALAAEPLGVLADSVKKWIGMEVPDNLALNLVAIANAISAFTFGGLGANAISEVAGPLGTLSDSVKKWTDVTVPENLKSNLSGLAEGIKGFSWLFLAGWSLSTITGPLGELADSVKKWSGVTMPGGLKDGLSGLADGISGFSWLFLSGWSLSAITGPLGDLADSIKKWANVSIPDGFGDKLKTVADGIKEFSAWDAIKISGIAEPLDTLGNAFIKFSNLSTEGANVTTFATNLKTCSTTLSEINTGAISVASTSINILVDLINRITATSVEGVATFVNAVNSLNNINLTESSFNSEVVSSISRAINNLILSLSTASAIDISQSNPISVAFGKLAKSGIDAFVNTTKKERPRLMQSIHDLLRPIDDFIRKKGPRIESACRDIITQGVNALKESATGGEEVGTDLAQGLINGLLSMVDEAYEAGYAVGAAAAKGQADGAGSHSPSVLGYATGRWLDIGLINGIESLGKSVYNAGYDTGDLAVTALSNSIAHISDIINGNLDAQPTIRPVLDLSDVSNGVSTMNSMFGLNPSVALMGNVGAISASMANRQNGSNNDVVSAIKDLGSKIKNNSGDTYYLNGITYDDGSNVASAVQTLVRAAQIERRI